MALLHASSSEVVNVKPLGAGLRSLKTSALFKSEDLSVLRLVLAKGCELREHQVPGEITIHCIEGVLVVTCEKTPKVLHAGEMLFLSRNSMHSLKALQDASALVTIALHATAGSA